MYFDYVAVAQVASSQQHGDFLGTVLLVTILIVGVILIFSSKDDR